MNSSESQPESESRMTYFDPEQPDASEHQFAVSLEQKAEAPAFVVEPGDAARPYAVLPDLPAARERELESPVAEGRTGETSPVDCNAPEPSPETTHSTDNWRDVVSAKVSNYRSRKPRKERYPSLQLPFAPDLYESARKESGHGRVPLAETPTLEENPLRMRDAQPILLEATARVLEFPRPVAPPIRTDELAEPVMVRPRIIEAPELLPPPPAMGGILIEAAAQPDPERRPGFDLPLSSASLERRAVAATADGLVVLSAAAMFAYTALRIMGAHLPSRTEAVLLGGLFALLWVAYQYSFLVFCGKTPGLLIARLQMQKFDGARVPRYLRRWRALVSILSLASLGLGYVWCFFDENHLSWHDRITKTHLSTMNSTKHA